MVIVEIFMLYNIPVEFQNTALGMKKYGYYWSQKVNWPKNEGLNQFQNLHYEQDSIVLQPGWRKRKLRNK